MHFCFSYLFYHTESSHAIFFASSSFHPSQNASAEEHAKLIREFGTKEGIKLCRELIEAGHIGLHFYCLNLENVTYDVMKELGLFKE